MTITEYQRAAYRQMHLDYGRQHRIERPLAHKATKAVSRAVKTGKLPPVETLKCVDCGAKAKHYDHRDYTKPLDVEPCCIRCNFRRGPAHPYIGAGSIKVPGVLERLEPWQHYSEARKRFGKKIPAGFGPPEREAAA